MFITTVPTGEGPDVIVSAHDGLGGWVQRLFRPLLTAGAVVVVGSLEGPGSAGVVEGPDVESPGGSPVGVVAQIGVPVQVHPAVRGDAEPLRHVGHFRHGAVTVPLLEPAPAPLEDAHAHRGVGLAEEGEVDAVQDQDSRAPRRARTSTACATSSWRASRSS